MNYSEVVLPCEDMTNIDDIEKCLICFGQINTPYRLTCGHSYCTVCFIDYLKSNILEGKVTIRCFHTIDDGNKESLESKSCDHVISEEEISTILLNEEELLKKYNRFKVLKNNPNARECPHCATVAIGSSLSPAITCAHCQAFFCFSHSTAHPPSVTCEQYEAQHAAESSINQSAITLICKACPSCSIYVSKTGGCNHMKCTNCQSSFCWLCGKQIDDEVFPAHFQWWNPLGCTNMQMSEEIEPSRLQLAWARLTGLLQAVLIGPLALVSTLLSVIVCAPCLPCYVQDVKTCNPRTYLQNCVTGWGFAWLAVLFLLPASIVTLAVLLAINVVLYPVYAFKRIRAGLYPWPSRQEMQAMSLPPPALPAPAMAAPVATAQGEGGGLGPGPADVSQGGGGGGAVVRVPDTEETFEITVL